jgi:probable F420-dependent oxidoreductase
VDFGVCVPNFGRNSSVEAMADVAVKAEELGYSTLWVTDHLAVPSEHAEPYGRTFEALTTLAWLSRLTSRVRLGTSILILPLRNPVEVARRVATIDCLSGGRTILGVGVGWLEKEFEFLNMNFHDRGARADEAIQLMRKIWSGERNIRTRHFHITDAVAEPRPIQGERLPIWVGGSSDAAIRRAARLGDGWHPVGVHPSLLPEMKRKLWGWSGGRRVKLTMRLFVDLFGRRLKGYRSSTGELRYAVGGSVDDVIDGLTPLAQEGVEEVAVYFGDVAREEYLRRLQAFAEEVAPSFR